MNHHWCNPRSLGVSQNQTSCHEQHCRGGSDPCMRLWNIDHSSKSTAILRPCLQPLRWFWLRALQENSPANLLYLTLMGTNNASQPYLQHSASNAALSRSLTSPSSLGKDSSSMTTCLDISDSSTMSGLSMVTAIMSGNLSCLPGWTSSCHLRSLSCSEDPGWHPRLWLLFDESWEDVCQLQASVREIKF